MIQLFFLGSGGGRFATINQRRGTGGFRLDAKRMKLHIDPGPGALVRSHFLSLNPLSLDGVLVTHAHPDHYTDAEILLEAMTRGGTVKKGVLLGNETVIKGNEWGGPMISKYHLSLPKKVIVAESGKMEDLGGMKVEVTPAIHGDPASIGLRFHTEEGIISYISDTEYFDELPEIHKGARVVIAEVTRPGNLRIPHHSCSEDAIKLLSEIRPELAITTHHGMKLILTGPEKEAKYIAEKSGIPTRAARIGMKVEIGERIKVSYQKEKEK